MKIIYVLIIWSFFSCTERKPGDKKPGNQKADKLSDISRTVALNDNNDTSDVIFETGGHHFKIHYYLNKPQYITIDNDSIGHSMQMNNFAKENKGVYLSFDQNSKKLNAFGVKYLNGHNAIEVILNSTGSDLSELRIWSEYSNVGNEYRFSPNKNELLKVYEYKNGERTDSFVLSKNHKP
jgi:hypothetical protein